MSFGTPEGVGRELYFLKKLCLNRMQDKRMAFKTTAIMGKY